MLFKDTFASIILSEDIRKFSGKMSNSWCLNIGEKLVLSKLILIKVHDSHVSHLLDTISI